MLLLPDPFGPATIQNFGLSSLLRDTVRRTKFLLVRAPGLGDISFENNAQVVSEGRTVGVHRKNLDALSARRVNSLRDDRTPTTACARLSGKLLDDDSRHLSLSLNFDQYSHFGGENHPCRRLEARFAKQTPRRVSASSG